jgi:hypothetical protein
MAGTVQRPVDLGLLTVNRPSSKGAIGGGGDDRVTVGRDVDGIAGGRKPYPELLVESVENRVHDHVTAGEGNGKDQWLIAAGSDAKRAPLQLRDFRAGGFGTGPDG